VFVEKSMVTKTSAELAVLILVWIFKVKLNGVLELFKRSFVSDIAFTETGPITSVPEANGLDETSNKTIPSIDVAVYIEE
jgi:hypothetical protein